MPPKTPLILVSILCAVVPIAGATPGDESALRSSSSVGFDSIQVLALALAGQIGTVWADTWCIISFRRRRQLRQVYRPYFLFLMGRFRTILFPAGGSRRVWWWYWAMRWILGVEFVYPTL